MSLDIIDIQEWLKLNQHKLSLAIEKSSCYKWTRWQADNSIHVFPCVCRTRNEECIFAEIYYRVWQVGKMLELEDDYISAIIEYGEFKGDKGALEEWFSHYKELSKDILMLEEKFKIAIEKEPYKVTEVILRMEEIKHLLKFREIYFEFVFLRYGQT